MLILYPKTACVQFTLISHLDCKEDAMAEVPTENGHISIDSDKDETCKICYGGNEEASDPLITPCLCAGSMGHVHHDCLVRWIKTAGK